jgi:microcystin-dependent protein
VSAPFVAEIRIMPYNFAPKGWAVCAGQLLPISQNTALFALLGTYYGGDGKSTFALPDLQGSVPLQQGQGQGLSDYFLGQTGGSDTVTLIQAEMPFHTHTLNAYNTLGDQPGPAGNSLANYGTKTYLPPPIQSQQTMAFQALPIAGASLPHNNDQPYLGLQFCIALQGVFPPRG